MEVSVGATLFVRFGDILHQKSRGVIQSIVPSVQVVRMPDTIHDIPLQRPRELAEEIMSNAAPQA
jgi:hypothetical protein